jgi:hypothetical protein
MDNTKQSQMNYLQTIEELQTEILNLKDKNKVITSKF